MKLISIFFTISFLVIQATEGCTDFSGTYVQEDNFCFSAKYSQTGCETILIETKKEQGTIQSQVLVMDGRFRTIRPGYSAAYKFEDPGIRISGMMLSPPFVSEDSFLSLDDKGAIVTNTRSFDEQGNLMGETTSRMLRVNNIFERESVCCRCDSYPLR